MQSDKPATYSVALRIRRVTYEDTYVSVPVVDAVTKQDQEGVWRIDPEALIAEAIRISADPRAEWKVESCESAPHPIQALKPEDRKSLDPRCDNEA